MYKLIKAPVHGYSEIPQQHRLLISFANLDQKKGTLTEQFSPIVCRDFLGDVLWAEETGKTASIYSFSYNPKTQKLDKDACRLVVSGNFAKEMRDNLPWLHAIEEKNKLEKTVLAPIGNHLFLTADKFWLQAGWTISAYTFLLKLMTFKDLNLEDIVKGHTNEGNYLMQITIPKFKKVMDNLRKIAAVDNTVTGRVNPASENIHHLHYYTGIVSVITGSSKCKYHSKIKELVA